MTIRYCPSDLDRSEIIAEARAEAIESAAEEMTAELREELDAMTDDYDAIRAALQAAHDALLGLESKTAILDTMHMTPDEVRRFVSSLCAAITEAREAAINALDPQE